MPDLRRKEKQPDDGGDAPPTSGGTAPKAPSKTTKRVMIALGVALLLVIIYNLSAGNL